MNAFRRLAESGLIKACKVLNVDLLAHAHVQIGVGHNTYFSGEEEIIEHSLAKILGRDPVVIVDAGANIGNYTVRLRKRFHEAAIHCFEPVPRNFDVLLANTAQLKVSCHPVGLSSKEEELELYEGSDDEEGSMATAYPEVLRDLFSFIGTIARVTTCRFITLDQFCETGAISCIDFLKIDVEGHELQVLKGATNLIAGGRILVVQFEFSEYDIVSRSFIKDFYDTLPGYRFFRILPGGKLLNMGNYRSELEIFRYQNILAVHPDLKNG